MKKTIFLLLCSLVSWSVSGQYSIPASQYDSLLQLLPKAKEDTAKVDLFWTLAAANQYSNTHQAVQYFNEALQLARKLDARTRIYGNLVSIGFFYGSIGEPAKAIELLQEALLYTEDAKEDPSLPLAGIAISYEAQSDLVNAIDYNRRAYFIFEKRLKDKLPVDERGYPAGPMRMGELFEKTGQLDFAMHYAQISYQRALEKPEAGNYFYCSICNLLGNVHSALKQPKEAIRFYRLALNKGLELNYQSSIQESQSALAKFYQKTNQPDSAIYYAAQAYEGAKTIKRFDVMKNAAGLLRTVYEKQGNYAQALFYNDLAIAARDSVSGAEKVREVQKLTHREERRQQQKLQEAEDARTAFQYKVRVYSLLAVLGGVLLLAFILYRNNRQKQKANVLLQEQKEEIDLQKNNAEKALTELKATQNQLIQSEKLASLGELTAGIAHEIQNPLNFVNNFAELSVDLAKELADELENDNIDKGFVKELMSDLASNQEKINHHGKRAASIVTGMLQHARTSSGNKELTDLNALADEYLRLSYHGLRAKDAGFNANMLTDFDPAIGKMEVIPQDIGRVFLNIINNAFYATAQRKKQEPEGFEPTVTVTSRLITPLQGAGGDDAVEFRIRDNGTGIPAAVKTRIFQPFFTTKPTGQGTGLGLSLAYDIVTKGHGGTLEVESTEGEGTVFIVTLPRKK